MGFGREDKSKDEDENGIKNREKKTANSGKIVATEKIGHIRI